MNLIRTLSNAQHELRRSARLLINGKITLSFLRNFSNISKIQVKNFTCRSGFTVLSLRYRCRASHAYLDCNEH